MAKRPEDIQRHGMTYAAEISRYDIEAPTREILTAFNRHERALLSLGVSKITYASDETPLHAPTGFVFNVSMCEESKLPSGIKSADRQNAILLVMQEVAENLSKRGGPAYTVTTGNSASRNQYASIHPVQQAAILAA